MGMAFLLGNWANDHGATRIVGRSDDRRLISSMFDTSLWTGRSATAVVVNRLVGSFSL